MMIGAVLMLAGAQLPFVHHRTPRGGETITYHRRVPPMCMGCSAYTITLGPDGQGILEVGEGAVTKEYRFQATPDELSAFTRRLRPYRPDGVVEIVAGRICHRAATEQYQVEITWTAADGRPSHLSYQEGCDMTKHRKMLAAIRSAPLLLPIGSYTGLP